MGARPNADAPAYFPDPGTYNVGLRGWDEETTAAAVLTVTVYTTKDWPSEDDDDGALAGQDNRPRKANPSQRDRDRRR